MPILSHMLETPKASCTLRTICDIIESYIIGRENHGDVTMDNQQERFDLDLAWLAGIIEGEGWISLALIQTIQKNKSCTSTFMPNIGCTNTDFQLMKKVEEIFNKLELKYRKQERPAFVGSDGRSRKAKIEVSIYAKEYVKKLSNAILPFMHGVKKNRILRLFDFYKIRESKPRSGKNSKYGIEEYEIYKELYGYRGKTRSKILNDLTLRLESNEQDKV